MKRFVCACAILMLLAAGCVGPAGQDTIKALQTQVADLSAAQPTATPVTEPTATKAAISSAFRGSSNGIQVQDDTAAFVAELATALEGAGWSILRTLEDAINVESPTGRKLRLQYSVAEGGIARLILFSVWSGVGESNLSCETLTALNEINDQYNLAKVSVDSDGDLWLESVYPIIGALDVTAFTDYMTWYESTEDVMVMGMLADYLQ